jgi:S1-C subfamily serine protease
LLIIFKLSIWLSQETSPSVVSIKDIELTKVPKTASNEVVLDEDEDAKVEGTGSGFIWDKFGHIVRKKSQKRGICLPHLI